MKFYGKIGYVYEIEDPPGVWSNEAHEREAYGDVLSNVRRWEVDQDVNDSVTTSNRLSVVADRFLCEHMGAMRYVKWNGTVWEIKSVELVRPRAILSLGGVYNGKQEDDSEEGETGSEESGDAQNERNEGRQWQR